MRILLDTQAFLITILDISFRDIVRVASLPFHHRDPFDRLLIAQALEGQAPVVTADPAFAHYRVKRIW